MRASFNLPQHRDCCAQAEREDAAAALCWQDTHLEQITGSGILIEEDQTYDIDARFISQWAVQSDRE